jgi:peptide deformylase
LTFPSSYDIFRCIKREERRNKMKLADKKLVEGVVCVELAHTHIKSYAKEFKDSMVKLLGPYGVGLAAPQINVKKQFFIMRMGDTIEFIANPKITKYDKVKTSMVEPLIIV